MEIKITKKKKPVWPWIIAILVILAIIFVLYTQFGDDVQRNINNDDNTSYIEPKKEEAVFDTNSFRDEIAYYDEVKDFINYVELDAEEAHPHFTRNATIYLANALSRMVDLEHMGDKNIEAKRAALLQSIKALSADSASAHQGQLISVAFNQAAGLMMAMQKKDYPALQPQMLHVEEIAKSFEPDLFNTETKSHAKEFFLLSKVALQAISEIDTF